MPVNPYQKYKQQSVMTLTPGEMLLRLYDEIIKQLNAAVIAIQEGNNPRCNDALIRCQKILSHLQSTLNYKYEIANNLWSLYDYFNRQIIKANIDKKTGPLEEVLPMVMELREAYAQAEKISRAQ